MNYSVSESLSSTGYFRSRDQTPLFYRHYAVDDQKATVLLVHGFGEHAGRYGHVIDHLRAMRFEVYCFDFRGHGRSQGTRGDMESFERYVEDVSAAVKFALQHKKAGQKFFILAHSMGALVSLCTVAQNPDGIDGLVLSSPLFGLKMPVPAWKRYAASALARVLPLARFGAGIKGEQLSADPLVAQAYDDDPLVLRKITVRAFLQLLKGIKGAKELPAKLKPSFFMQVAGHDTVVDSKAAESWFSLMKNKSRDATMKIYPDFLHEIYNEIHREEAINDAVKWFADRA